MHEDRLEAGAEKLAVVRRQIFRKQLSKGQAFGVSVADELGGSGHGSNDTDEKRERDRHGDDLVWEHFCRHLRLNWAYAQPKWVSFARFIRESKSFGSDLSDTRLRW